MLSARKPTQTQIEEYLEEARSSLPQHPSAVGVIDGFRRDRFTRNIGRGDDDFDAAKEGLRRWVGHRWAGVEVHPGEVDVSVDNTVVLVLRQLRLWVLAPCRIETVVEKDDSFGFTYATLIDHPVLGYETFLIQRGSNDMVRFHIEAVSRPNTVLARAASPISHALQKQITNRYLDGLERYVASK